MNPSQQYQPWVLPAGFANSLALFKAKHQPAIHVNLFGALRQDHSEADIVVSRAAVEAQIIDDQRNGVNVDWAALVTTVINDMSSHADDTHLLEAFNFLAQFAEPAKKPNPLNPANPPTNDQLKASLASLVTGFANADTADVACIVPSPAELRFLTEVPDLSMRGDPCIAPIGAVPVAVQRLSPSDRSQPSLEQQICAIYDSFFEKKHRDAFDKAKASRDAPIPAPLSLPGIHQATSRASLGNGPNPPRHGFSFTQSFAVSQHDSAQVDLRARRLDELRNMSADDLKREKLIIELADREQRDVKGKIRDKLTSTQGTPAYQMYVALSLAQGERVFPLSTFSQGALLLAAKEAFTGTEDAIFKTTRTIYQNKQSQITDELQFQEATHCFTDIANKALGFASLESPDRAIVLHDGTKASHADVFASINEFLRIFHASSCKLPADRKAEVFDTIVSRLGNGIRSFIIADYHRDHVAQGLLSQAVTNYLIEQTNKHVRQPQAVNRRNSFLRSPGNSNPNGQGRGDPYRRSTDRRGSVDRNKRQQDRDSNGSSQPDERSKFVKEKYQSACRDKGICLNFNKNPQGCSYKGCRFEHCCVICAAAGLSKTDTHRAYTADKGGGHTCKAQLPPGFPPVV